MPKSLMQKNKLGLWTSTSLVVGNMIGSGVFNAGGFGSLWRYQFIWLGFFCHWRFFAGKGFQ